MTLRARRGVCGIGAMMEFVCVCLVFSICSAGCAALLTLLLRSSGAFRWFASEMVLLFEAMRKSRMRAASPCHVPLQPALQISVQVAKERACAVFVYDRESGSGCASHDAEFGLSSSFYRGYATPSIYPSLSG